MNIEELEQKFINLLADLGKYIEFSEYFKDSTMTRTKLLTLPPCNWVKNAFDWNKTNEGSKFWNDVHNKWNHVLLSDTSTTFKPEIKPVTPTNSLYCSCITPNIKPNHAGGNTFMVCLTCKKERL